MSSDAAESLKPSWAHYYEDEITWAAHFTNVIHHLPFFRLIRSLRPRSILEIGAGSGSTSTFLSYFIPRVLAIDISPEIVKRCQQRSPRFFGRANYREADAFYLDAFVSGEFELAVSQGFFEHFPDEQIARLLDEQLRVARRVAFSVPNATYGKQDFGDERLMTREAWDSLIIRLGFRVDKSFDYAPFHVRRRGMAGAGRLIKGCTSGLSASTTTGDQGRIGRSRAVGLIERLKQDWRLPAVMYAAVVSRR